MRIITISREFGSGGRELGKLSLPLPGRMDWMRAMWKWRWNNGTGRLCL